MSLQTGNLWVILTILCQWKAGWLLVMLMWAREIDKEKKKREIERSNFYTMKKLSHVSVALESVGIQVSTASYHFLTQVVNCTSGLNGLLSWWKICWWGQISVAANVVTLEQQVAAESCCGDWPGACSPSCRVKLLPESHLWMFWAASQCPR